MKRRVNITIDEELDDRVPIYAKDVKLNKSSLIEKLLKEYMDNVNPEKLIQEVQEKIDKTKERQAKELKELEDEKERLLARLPYYNDFVNMDEEAINSWAIGQAKRLKYNKEMAENVRRACKRKSTTFNKAPDELWAVVNSLLDEVEPNEWDISVFKNEPIIKSCVSKE